MDPPPACYALVCSLPLQVLAGLLFRSGWYHGTSPAGHWRRNLLHLLAEKHLPLLEASLAAALAAPDADDDLCTSVSGAWGLSVPWRMCTCHDWLPAL